MVFTVGLPPPPPPACSKIHVTALVFMRHLENVPWDAVSTTAGKTPARNREEQKYQGLMKPRVNYAMCLGAILKMYPGMLSAQLLGKLLPEIEKSRNTRD